MPALTPNKAPDPGFGVYFHWPFCRKKCPYCDFNSHVREAVDQRAWADALIAEFKYFADRIEPQTVTSIFFGGGTPSLMQPDTVHRIIEGVKEQFSVASDMEVSLEANPTSAEAENFKGYADAGVNRLSMGVQSLQGQALQFLGREHSVKEALQTIEMARSIFPNISFDLIYALPGQSLSDWEKDLKAALSLAGDHISLYQLTIEPNTGFAGAYKRGEFNLPKDEIAEEMYMATQDICGEAGLPSYEISNHAKPGAECQHNLTYWRYGGYLGVGPGAHGRLPSGRGRIATNQIKKPEGWLQKVLQQGHGTEAELAISDRVEMAEEMLLMGLRLKEGVWFENFETITGLQFNQVVKPENLQPLTDADLLEVSDQFIAATDEGRFVLNSVLAHLLS